MAEKVVSDVTVNYQSKGADQAIDDTKKLAGGLDGITVAGGKTEPVIASVENRFKSLERQLDTTEGNAAKFAKVQDTVNKAVAQNPALMERGNEILKQAEQRYLGAGHAAEGFSGQSQALMHSIRSVGEQLALGIGPVQALTGQLSHLSYVMTAEGGITGAFSQLATKARGGLTALAEAITPMRAVAGAATVLGAAGAAAAYQWMDAQEKISQSLIGIGRRTGTTGADINKFASDNATATGLSVSEARNAAIAFTKTGDIAVGQLKGLGEAVHGFSILTGTNATEAAKTLAKALSGDLVVGAKEFDQVYGALDGRTLQLIATLQATGERQQAQAIILKALEEQNKKAADSVGILTKAYNALGNEIAATAAQLGKALTFNLPGDRRTPLEVQSDKNKSQMAADTQGGDAAVKSLLPQIDAYQKLIGLQEDLNKARESSGAQGLGGFNEAAAVAAENAAKSTKEALQDSIAYGQSVKEIAARYSDLTTAGALAHQQAVNLLPVVQARTEAEKMAAQFAADYWNALEKGVAPATALQQSADKRAASEAAAVTAAAKTTQGLQDQNELAKAYNIYDEKRIASAQAYQKVIEQIGDTEKGRAAAQERSDAVEESYRIKINKEQEKMTSGLTDADRNAKNLGYTLGAGAEFMGKMGTYVDQIASAMPDVAGNFRTASLAAGSLEDYLVGASLAAERLAAVTDAVAENTARTAKTAADMAAASKSIFTPTTMTGQFTTDLNVFSLSRAAAAVLPKSTLADVANQLSGQKSSAQLEVEAAGRTRGAAAEPLKNSIDDLKTSTDSLNATNQELLSPYYTQDPRTSHIGFRSQGMAAGGYVDVPGLPSANDNLLATIPVASGERIYVDPQSQKRGTGGGTVINISAPMTFNGPVNKDEVGRTAYQSMQLAAKQMASVR